MADRLRDRPSLKDLDGVRVAVEPLSAGAITLGITEGLLKANTEALIREARLRVLGQGDFPTGDPHLRLSASVTERAGLVACALQVAFVQIVFMRRDPSVTFNRGQTWKADAEVVLVPAPELVAAVTTELRRQVGQFLEDYRAVS